jgi:hypothetical protein
MEPEKLEAALQLSIDNYSRMITLLHRIETEIGSASHEALRKMNSLLTEMQTQASATDRLVITAKDEPASENVRALISTRARLINDILLLNSNVTVKAMGVKSLLAHEIGTLRNGKSALDGYRPQQHNQGRIVSRAL